jgi:uncharacterized cofD-like protein
VSTTGISIVPDPKVAPKVVALGGGHGLAVALRAIRRYAGAVTAVVSVADDGGSSGRLRRDLDVVPPGDLRMCLVALAEPGSRWSTVFDYRFDSGELDGHSLGNLILVGLEETLDDLTEALDEAARALGATGRVRPATTERVVLKAHLEPADSQGGGRAPGQVHAIEGQVAVANSPGRIRRVELVPRDVPAHPDVLAALAEADQIVLAPGSLYTSLLPVLAVPALRQAVTAAQAQVVQVCNLGPQLPETEGLDAVDHLRAVVDHGGRVDVFLAQAQGRLACDLGAVRALGAEPVLADVSGPNGHEHDPARLAVTLSDLLESTPGRDGPAPSGRVGT